MMKPGTVRLPSILGSILYFCLVSASAQELLLDQEQNAFKEAALYAAPSVVQVETYAGLDVTNTDQNPLGTFTGTVIDNQGLIITSLFPLRNQVASITVVLPNRERVPAKVISRDFNRELALLKIEPTVPLRAIVPSPSKDWRIGQWVIALGKSFDPVDVSRSVGILSARGRIFDKAIQTDAKISPLNYGGPIIDLHGRALGILTPLNPSIATEGEVQQWYDSGIGFAIPIDSVLERLEAMGQGKDLFPGKLGIRPKNRNDFEGPVVLAGVSPGSPAAQAGLKADDTIESIDGKPISQMNQLRHALGPKDAEQFVQVGIRRGGESISLQCELVKEIPLYREPFLGFLLETSDSTSLQIAAVLKGSPAEIGGLQKGHTIRSINGQEIRDREQLRHAILFVDHRAPMKIGVRDPAEDERTVQPTFWSKDLIGEMPTLERPKAEEGKGLVDIPLGDVPNKAFAFVPKSYASKIPHGLILLLPEAGEIDRKLLVDAWEPFCREHRWILGVLGAGDAKQWNLEEIELIQRVRRQLEGDYRLDPRRTTIGGFGTGGSFASIAALQEKGTYRGVWLAESKLPMVRKMQAAEPMESTHWLLLGSKKEYPVFAESIQKVGFTATVDPEAVDLKKSTQGNHMSLLQKWLRRLEVY